MALEDFHGKSSVTSTTVVKNPRSTVNNRVLPTGEFVEIVNSSNGKAVKITAKDEFGNVRKIANIPYDSRGLPIFDDVAKFTTLIEKPKNYTELKSKARRNMEMKNATLELRKQINDGRVLFTNETITK